MLNNQQKPMRESKYKNIKPIIDTGCSKTNYEIYLREKFRDMLIKEHEGFKRIKVKSLISIIEEINLVIEQLNNIPTDDTIDKVKLENHILLLDVREYQEYKQCHIKGAINYPHTHLFRGANQYSNEILKYKNKNDKLIIIYDKNERLAQKVAQGLLERNILNCFMLSGGIIAMAREYPEYIVGEIPKDIIEKMSNRLEIERKDNNKMHHSLIPMEGELKSLDINMYNGQHLPTTTKKSTHLYEMNTRHYRSISQLSNSSSTSSSSKSFLKKPTNLYEINTSHRRSPSQLSNVSSISSTSSKSCLKKPTNLYEINTSHHRSPSQLSNVSSISSTSSKSSSLKIPTNLYELNTGHHRSPSQLSNASTTSSKSTSTQNSDKKFERITYYSDLKKPQPITDPFDFSMIKKNIPIMIIKDSEENKKNPYKSKLSNKPPSPPPLVNTNYHALWRIKPKPITEKITNIKMDTINNKR